MRVCVPIDVATCDDFDPLGSPAVGDLLRDLAEYDRKAPAPAPGAKAVKDWQKTSLAPYIQHLKAYIKGMEGEIRLARSRKLGTAPFVR